MSEQHQNGGLSETSAKTSSSIDSEDFLKIYEIFRDYTKQEDRLILGRLTAILTIHGFLYTTYGLTIQKKLEISEKLAELTVSRLSDCSHMEKISKSIEALIGTFNQNNRFIISIGVVGFLISLLGALSIWTAAAATKNLRNVFDGQFHYLKSKRTDIKGDVFEVKHKKGFLITLNSLTGGGRKEIENLSYFAPIGIPLILAAAWILILGVSYWYREINSPLFLEDKSSESLRCTQSSKNMTVRLPSFADLYQNYAQ